MAHRVETPFLHEQLRHLEPPAAQNEDVEFLKGIVGKWVRVVISDKRAFVGVLEAIDGHLNLVLGNPVEVRPAPTAGGPDETKSHRGSVTINGQHIEQFGLYNKGDDGAAQ